MGKTVIGDLAVRVGADTSGLTKGMSRSKKQIRQLSNEAKAGGKQLAKYAAAAAAAGSAIAVGLVANSIKASREAANLAKIGNASIPVFKKMTVAARTVGIEQSKLSDILKDMTDRVGDFISTGGGPMADFFENIAPKVGVTAQQFKNLSGPQALQLYVSSLEKANLSQSEMTFYMEAIASDSTALLPLLRNGGALMSEYADQVDRLGIALSDVQSEEIEAAANAMAMARDVSSGFVDQMTAELSPVITAVSRQFIDAAADAGGVGVAATSAAERAVGAFGFIMDAVAGFHRTVILAGKGVAGLGLGIVDVMLTAANAIVNKPVQALNELLAKINEFAGTDFQPVSLTGLGQNIQKELEIVRGAQDEFMADFQSTLMEPLPSTQFEQFVAQAREYSEEAAREAAKIRESFMGQSDGAPGSAETGNLSDKMDAIRQSNMAEIELMREKHELELEEIARAKEAEIEIRGTYDELLQETAARHQKELTELEKRESDRRKKLAEDERRFKVDALDDALSNMTTLMNTGSRKMFEIGKFAANSNALLNTYEAVTGAYKVGASIGGPVLGAAYGTAAFGAQMAQVQKINSTQFGGSGGASGSNTQAINDSGTPVESAGSASQQSVSITLDVRGSDQDRAVAGSIVEQINAEAERGMRISRVALA